MKQSESITNLAKALSAVHRDVKPIAKDATNPHFKNRYASLDAIMDAVRPLLTVNGLAIVQGGGAPVSDVSGVVTGVSVETLLVHTSGEYLSSAITLPIDKPTPQAVGGAITYGRRYGVAALLALTTEEDDDAQSASVPRAVTSPAARPTTATSSPASTQTVQTATTPATASSNGAHVADGDDMECPKCGGEMWDNRVGKTNPKAPDFKCKNAPRQRGGEGCDGVIWPPKAMPAGKPGRESVHGPYEEEVPF